MCLWPRARISRAVYLGLGFVSCFVLAVLAYGALINPPDLQPHSPDPFSGCSGCTFLAALPPQTVTSSNRNWQATMVTAVFMDPTPITGLRSGAGLDFFYQITNVSPCTACTSGPDDIVRFVVVDFSTASTPGLLVDVGINAGPVPGFTGAGPSSARPGDVDRVPPGDVIGWNFHHPGSVSLAPGTTSIILEIATNATHYKPGKSAGIDGGTADFNSFAPAP